MLHDLDWYRRVLRAGKLASAVTAVLALLNILLVAVVAVVGWLALQAGLPPIVVAVLILDLAAVFLGQLLLSLIYRETRKPYRAALKGVIRDYYAEVGRLEAELDPKGRQRPSARLHSGRADPEWAGPIYDLYGVPREDSYGD